LFQIPACLFVNFSGPGQFTSTFQVPASSRQLHSLSRLFPEYEDNLDFTSLSRLFPEYEDNLDYSLSRLFPEYEDNLDFTSLSRLFPEYEDNLDLLLWSYVTVPGLARRTVGQPERNSAGSHSAHWRFKC
jgi:hypothetical protein